METIPDSSGCHFRRPRGSVHHGVEGQPEGIISPYGVALFVPIPGCAAAISCWQEEPKTNICSCMICPSRAGHPSGTFLPFSHRRSTQHSPAPDVHTVISLESAFFQHGVTLKTMRCRGSPPSWTISTRKYLTFKDNPVMLRQPLLCCLRQTRTSQRETG